MRWHYTSLVRLKQILKAGVLLPHSCEGELPAVWFSSNQNWEETASKRLSTMQHRMSFEAQAVSIGCARVGVEREDLLNFEQWAALSRQSPDWFLSIVFGGIELGARPEEWFCSLEPVTNRDWRSVQVWRGIQWLGLEDL